MKHDDLMSFRLPGMKLLTFAAFPYTIKYEVIKTKNLVDWMLEA
jgi:hypothetical protein